MGCPMLPLAQRHGKHLVGRLPAPLSPKRAALLPVGPASSIPGECSSRSSSTHCTHISTRLWMSSSLSTCLDTEGPRSIILITTWLPLPPFSLFRAKYTWPSVVLNNSLTGS